MARKSGGGSNTPVGTGKTSWVGLLLGTLVGAVAVAGFTFGIFPGLSRTVAPLVCPAGTTSSQVVLDVTHSNNKTTSTPHLVCTLDDGRMVRVGPGTLFLTEAAALWAMLSALSAVSALRGRSP